MCTQPQFHAVPLLDLDGVARELVHRAAETLTLGALSDLVCEGKARAISASSWASLTHRFELGTTPARRVLRRHRGTPLAADVCLGRQRKACGRPFGQPGEAMKDAADDRYA
jgi:hypothetical protein